MFNTSRTTTPQSRFHKRGWYQTHCQHNVLLTKKDPTLLLIGDSIVAGLSRYKTVWDKHFAGYNTINCGIGGDKIQHTLWRAEKLKLPQSIRFIFVCSGTNNLETDCPQDIVDGLVCVALSLKRKLNHVHVIVSGILPRGLLPSKTRTKIHQINNKLHHFFQKNPSVTLLHENKEASN